MTFMNASVTRRRRRAPVDEAIAVCTSPAVQTPNASRPCSPATANAARSAPAARAGVELGGRGVEAVVAASARRGSREPRMRARARASRRRARRPRRAPAVARSASSSRRFVEAIAVWPSRRQRISTLVSSTAVACVGAERAKRDSSERSRTTVTCASAPAQRERPLGDLERALGRGSRHADLDVAKARRRGAVRHAHDLAGLALAAVAEAAQLPRGRRADGVERSPELRRHARVGGVSQQPPELAAADLARDLGRELKLQAAVVDRPRAVGLEVQAVVGVGDEVGERARRRRARSRRSSCARSAGGRSRRRARSRPSARGRSPPRTADRTARRAACRPRSAACASRRRPRRPSRTSRGRRAASRRR